MPDEMNWIDVRRALEEVSGEPSTRELALQNILTMVPRGAEDAIPAQEMAALCFTGCVQAATQRGEQGRLLDFGLFLREVREVLRQVLTPEQATAFDNAADAHWDSVRPPVLNPPGE